MDRWILKITLSGITRDHLINTGKLYLEPVIKRLSNKELPITGNTSGGWADGGDSSCIIEISTPLEAKIKMLRDEADTLERQLNGR